MSYIQIEIGGKMRGLKFNQLAIEIISMHNDTQTSSGFLYAMIYGGLKGNSYVKREEAEYTFENVCDWVDDMPNKEQVITDVTACLTETQIWKELVKKGQENIVEAEKKEGKKKA